MTIKNTLAALTLGVVGLSVGASAAVAQASPETILDVELENTGDIRFVEGREEAFHEELNQTILAVGLEFNAPEEVIEQSLILSNNLDRIGVGQNTQVAQTLCAIGTEVPSRRETFRQAFFHLNTVEELLAETISQPAEAIDAELSSAFTASPSPTYLYIHGSLEESNCVPPTVIANLFEVQ